MNEKLINIKEVSLNNNCPECYNNNGLRFSIKQKIIETKFYKSITSEVKYELECKNCNTFIYPVQWTDDIDRVVDYQKKAFQPKPTSTYLKKASWITIISAFVLLTLILTLIYLVEL